MQKYLISFVLVFCLCFLTISKPVNADAAPDGLWYGTWEITEGVFAGFSNIFSINFEQEPHGLFARLYVPDLGLFGASLPVSISGNIVTIFDPIYASAEITGELNDDSLDGFESPLGFYAWVEFADIGWQYLEGIWRADKYIPLNESPGDKPEQPCENLPPLYCMGDSQFCSDLVPFSPDAGEGYTVQTYEEYGYVRRDLMMLIKYATAKTACMTAGWDYGSMGPLGLLDMSEADGTTPKFPDGVYRHPPGSHEDGNDIDTAYYQLFSDDNLARTVGLNYDYHLVEPPYNFDKYRTALYISYLAEHPLLRVVGVDGQIGLILDGTDITEGTFDELVDMEWINPDLRNTIPLAYEVEDTGRGWFRFHHHHLHASMNHVHDIVSSVEINPVTLNRYSRGKKITVHMEFIEGIDIFQIDPNYVQSVALILNGHTMLYAQPEDWETSDYNENGIADLTVKFDRAEVLESIGEGNVELSIIGMAGAMVDDDLYGILFQESDTINVIGPPPQTKGHKKPAAPFSRPGGRKFLPE